MRNLVCYATLYTYTHTHIHFAAHCAMRYTRTVRIRINAASHTAHRPTFHFNTHRIYSTRCVLVQYTLVARCNFLSFHSFFLFFHSFFLISLLFISAVLIHNLLFPKHIAIFLRDSHMQFPSSYIHFSKLKIKKSTRYR